MNELYNKKYYDREEWKYTDREFWGKVFQRIADQIIRDFNPETVLDAGCAFGYLVSAFRKRGVQAYGIDISDYAISRVDNTIKEYCYVGSLSEDFPVELPKKFDLVVTIETLEHLQAADGKIAIAKLCKLSDTIIFSSSPDAFEDETHFNVQPLEYWVTQFARNDFYRELNYKATYISLQAMVFEKGNNDIYEIIQKYEKALYLKDKELREAINKGILYRAKRYLKLIKKWLKNHSAGI